MSIYVTVSEFRNNLSYYLDLLIKGKSISISDGRKGRRLLTIVKSKKAVKKFDWDEQIKFVESIGGGLFTDEDVKAIKDLRKRSRERAKRLDW